MENAVYRLHNRLIREQSSRISAVRELVAAGHVPIGGGADSPVHPLGPPTVSGTTVTVDTMLNSPTRITRMIMDLTLQRFVVDRIFASAGGVTGGAVVFDVAQENELYLSRDVQRVAPGGEFPVVEGERLAPSVAEVEKWGGKVFIPDESKDRNNTALFTNKVRQLANTQVRKINQRCIEVLEAAISTNTRTVTGRDWSDVVVGGSSQSNADEFPVRDFALAGQTAEEEEMGISYTLWILNPQEWSQLVIIYGASGLRELLQEMNISVYVSNRVTAGTAYVVAEQQVGEMRVEKPLGTETWREPKTERTWVQSSVRPVMYVTNPFAVLKFTGLAG